MSTIKITEETLDKLAELIAKYMKDRYPEVVEKCEVREQMEPGEVQTVHRRGEGKRRERTL